MTFRLLVITFICFLGVQCQVPSAGKCPKIDKVQQNFDLNKYLGKWYEQVKYFAIFELDGKCITANYSLADDGTIKVLNQQIDKSSNKTKSIEGTARPQADVTEGKLLVNFNNLPFHFDAPYWILETDYNNFSVVWSCTEISIVHTKFAWILTRERSPQIDIMEKAYAVFDKFNLDKNGLLITEQNDCPDGH